MDHPIDPAARTVLRTAPRAGLRKPPAPWAALRAAWRHRALVAPLARREIEARYRGSALGVLWSLAQPLLLLGVYSFVFGAILQLRWAPRGVAPAPEVGPGRFALLLFAGLIVFNVFGECVSRAPELLRQHASFIKKVVFPIEILPWAMLLVALWNAAASGLVLLAFHLALLGPPPATTLLAPLVLLPFLLFVLGLSWFLASVGLYLRDTQQVVGLLVTMTLFLSPIFYPLSLVPEAYRPLIHLNPLTPTIEALRGVVFWGEVPDAAAWLLQLAAGGAALWLGHAWFERTREGFADVA